mgnify:CR=1 FL=1
MRFHQLKDGYYGKVYRFGFGGAGGWGLLIVSDNEDRTYFLFDWSRQSHPELGIRLLVWPGYVLAWYFRYRPWKYRHFDKDDNPWTPPFDGAFVVDPVRLYTVAEIGWEEPRAV